MATYECSKCGMSVNATCAKCNAQLVNDTLKLDDVQKFKYLNVLITMERLNHQCVVDKI